MSADPFPSCAAARAWLDRLGDNVDKIGRDDRRCPYRARHSLARPGRAQARRKSCAVSSTTNIKGAASERRCMTELLAKARADRRLRRAELYVDCQNLAAIALYLKFGFVIEGRHENFAISEETLHRHVYDGQNALKVRDAFLNGSARRGAHRRRVPRGARGRIFAAMPSSRGRIRRLQGIVALARCEPARLASRARRLSGITRS